MNFADETRQAQWIPCRVLITSDLVEDILSSIIPCGPFY